MLSSVLEETPLTSTANAGQPSTRFLTELRSPAQSHGILKMDNGREVKRLRRDSSNNEGTAIDMRMRPRQVGRGFVNESVEDLEDYGKMSSFRRHELRLASRKKSPP